MTERETERAVVLHVQTDDDEPDVLRLLIETATRTIVVEMDFEEAQKLAMVMLHYSGADRGRAPS